MSIIVKQDLCVGCGICVDVCPHQAISLWENKAFIDQQKCTLCHQCVSVCPTGALQVSEASTLVDLREQQFQDQPVPVLHGEIVPQKTRPNAAVVLLKLISYLPPVIKILGDLMNRPPAPFQQARKPEKTMDGIRGSQYGNRRRYRGGRS